MEEHTKNAVVDGLEIALAIIREEHCLIDAAIAIQEEIDKLNAIKTIAND